MMLKFTERIYPFGLCDVIYKVYKFLAFLSPEGTGLTMSLYRQTEQQLGSPQPLVPFL